MAQIIAHRGASYDAPENTASAIALALQKGAKIIEFDVMVSRDGGLFLFHDKDLKRLCNRNGSIGELPSAAVKKLDVGSWFPRGDFSNETPPTLVAAIRQCLEGGATPLIEHKTGSAEAYGSVLLELDVIEKVIVQSFDWDFLRSIRNLLPALKIGALGSKTLAKRKDELAKLNPDWVGWKYSDITNADIQWLANQGVKIACWTVNDPRDAQRLVTAGTDAIITDRPKLIADALD